MGLALSLPIPRCDEDLICNPQLSHWCHHDDEDEDEDVDDVLSTSKVDGHSEDMDQDRHDESTEVRVTDGSEGKIRIMNLCMVVIMKTPKRK